MDSWPGGVHIFLVCLSARLRRPRVAEHCGIEPEGIGQPEKGANGGLLKQSLSAGLSHGIAPATHGTQPPRLSFPTCVARGFCSS